jgi:hypothetical protein
MLHQSKIIPFLARILNHMDFQFDTFSNSLQLL